MESKCCVSFLIIVTEPDPVAWEIFYRSYQVESMSQWYTNGSWRSWFPCVRLSCTIFVSLSSGGNWLHFHVWWLGFWQVTDDWLIIVFFVPHLQRYSTLLQGRFELFFHTMYILIHLSEVLGSMLCNLFCVAIFNWYCQWFRDDFPLILHKFFLKYAQAD